MTRPALLPLLVILFILSGAAGLFYEAVWSRYLSLFVGHGAYAQVITLVIFLGGLGIGALVVSGRSARLKDPLLAYGLVEAVIGVIGLVFHDAIYQPATRFAYDTLFPAIGGGPLLLVVKWTLAGALILPQSILLGATFPLMTAGVLRRRPERPGLLISVLYFANSLGAAAGVLLAGFWLYAMAGLPGTLLAAAMLNFVVGLGAILASRAWPPEPQGEFIPHPSPAEDPLTAHRSPLTGAGLPRLLVVLAAGTAIASFVYEVAWIRMLSLVLGSSTHAFELMLSAFILGLAFGALWIRQRADRLTNPLRTLVIVQLAMGGLAMASLPLYLASFDWTASILSAVARTPSGYTAFTLARYVVCLAVMLPATFCAGMTLPLMTKMLLAAGSGERAIGTIYGANTLGSIAGAALAGLVLLPVLGLKGTVVFGAGLDMLLGILAGLYLVGRPGRRLTLAGAGLLGVSTALALFLLPWNQQLLSSGVFRAGRIAFRPDQQIAFHEDGRTATVHASLFASTGGRIIATNGKTDGSLSAAWFRACGEGARRPFAGDDGTQALLALLTLAHAPAAKVGAVIGHGTGMSSHLLLGSSSLEEVVTIEIEPAMVRGSREFYPANRRVFDDPRSRLVYDDARAYFAASNRRVDLVLSEPSNPWVSGVSGLFTVEFYAQVKRYLAPGAVFGQWLHTYEMNDGLVIGMLASIHEEFADYRVYQLNNADLLVVATAEGRLRRPDWSVFAEPAVQEDLCRFAPTPGFALDHLAILDRASLAPLFAYEIRPNSDFYPALDLGAERARFLNEQASGFMGVASGVVGYVERAVDDQAPLSGPTAVDNVSGIRAIQVALSLRRDLRDRGDSAWTQGPGDTQRHLMRVWASQAGSGQPPGSWRGWTSDFWSVFRSMHAGGLGPDTLFFSLAQGHAQRRGAPPAVQETIRFALGLARRDSLAASASARVLLAEARAGRTWLPAEDLLDGAVRSLAAAGLDQEAREAFTMLAPVSNRSATDLRLILLNAYIARPRTGTDGTVHD